MKYLTLVIITILFLSSCGNNSEQKENLTGWEYEIDHEIERFQSQYEREMEYGKGEVKMPLDIWIDYRKEIKPGLREYLDTIGDSVIIVQFMDHGEWTDYGRKYTTNDILKEQWEFKDGTVFGYYEYFDTSGKLIEERSYYMDGDEPILEEYLIYRESGYVNDEESAYIYADILTNQEEKYISLLFSGKLENSSSVSVVAEFAESRYLRHKDSVSQTSPNVIIDIPANLKWEWVHLSCEACYSYEQNNETIDVCREFHKRLYN
ncbi:hypothetical protein K6119_16770 [Paracrocinitomix mangrovi]|uniref:hypothetical protein n=1 Tax=Paracrocinitomix mangrovi TaxID=2862509 RepID=UPI001C8D6DE3|nr:hypothetical protein [Paracrocinitomix mangrovi]UKN01381.1 hypothetical protein K6119_16770 [Paracrocinitomix mangrovi]